MKLVSVGAFLATAAMLVASQPGLAADGHGHGKAGSAAHGSHELKPRHGGAVAEVGDVVYELVTKPEGVVVYVTDHGKPLATQGAKATLTFTSGSKKVDVALAPAGRNELRGAADLKAMGADKAVATVSLAGKQAATVRFGTK